MTGAEGTQLYPNLCLRQALGGQAITACAECPIPDPESSCVAFTASRLLIEQTAAINSLTEQNETLTEENVRLLERILGLKTDSLVVGMFTPEGLKDEVENNAELAEKLMGDDWAALQVDVRFLSFINLALGQNPGDSFLQYSGGEISAIAHGLVRQGPRRTEELGANRERRTMRPEGRRAADFEPGTPGRTLDGDILARRGGDEFMVILFGVSREDLPKVVRRWRNQLSVEAALRRAPDGIPFIGSIGAAHVTDIDRKLMEGNDAYGRLKMVDDKSSLAAVAAKKSQYRAMWKKLQSDSGGKLAGFPQLNDRAVAELFITTYFPGFIRNHADVLGRRQD